MTSSRIAIRLALGILFGVALVLLPAVFSTGTSAPSPRSNSTSSGNLFPQLTNAPAQFGRISGLNSSGSTPLSFLTIILFIFLPSTIVSIVVRRWAEKRAREYL